MFSTSDKFSGALLVWLVSLRLLLWFMREKINYVPSLSICMGSAWKKCQMFWRQQQIESNAELWRKTKKAQWSLISGPRASTCVVTFNWTFSIFLTLLLLSHSIELLQIVSIPASMTCEINEWNRYMCEYKNFISADDVALGEQETFDWDLEMS